jgi:hypothetical protein
MQRKIFQDAATKRNSIRRRRNQADTISEQGSSCLTRHPGHECTA